MEIHVEATAAGQASRRSFWLSLRVRLFVLALNHLLFFGLLEHSLLSADGAASAAAGGLLIILKSLGSLLLPQQGTRSLVPPSSLLVYLKQHGRSLYFQVSH
jgi:hypothetical protein